MKYNINNRRYTGSKYKLINWIFSIIQKECEGDSFCDIFAGTGIVSYSASGIYNRIIVNDLLLSNYINYQAFFGKEDVDDNKILKIAEEYNKMNAESANYVSNNFGDKYFSNNDAIKIGEIRENLERIKGELNNREFCILLSSLLYSMDKISNTVGHYEAYIKNAEIRDRFEYNLVDYKSLENSTSNFEIYQEDANILADKIECDIVYLDPPYNSRQYSRFYHVLENIAEWQQPTLYGVAMKPEPKNMSEYCRNTATKTLRDLVNKLKCKYIVVSYNNTYNSKSSSSQNKISFESIREILGTRGEVKEYSKSHQCFNAGKTDFLDHKEYLFIVEVK